MVRARKIREEQIQQKYEADYKRLYAEWLKRDQEMLMRPERLFVFGRFWEEIRV